MMTVFFGILLLMFPLIGHADRVIAPPNGKWGDDNATEKMLQMTHDPMDGATEGDVIDAGQDQYKITPSCTDDAGDVLTDHDAGYEDCMAKRRVRESKGNPPRNRTAEATAISPAASGGSLNQSASGSPTLSTPR